MITKMMSLERQAAGHEKEPSMKMVYWVAFCVLGSGCLRAQESFLPATTGPYAIGRTLVLWTDTARAANEVLDQTFDGEQQGYLCLRCLC